MAAERNVPLGRLGIDRNIMISILKLNAQQNVLKMAVSPSLSCAACNIMKNYMNSSQSLLYFLMNALR